MNQSILRYKCAFKAAFSIFKAMRTIHPAPGDTIKIVYTMDIDKDIKERIESAVSMAFGGR